MYRGRDFVGKPVFAYDIGKKLNATVKELILSQSRKKLRGFIVAQSAADTKALLLPLDRVQSLHPDAVMIDSQSVLVSLKERELKQILEQQSFRNSKVITTQGQDLGTVVDIYFDLESGVVKGYEVSGKFIADTDSGRSFIQATKETTIQNNVIFVSPDAALAKDQVGGIQDAIQKAKEKAKETTQITSEKLQEATQAAGEKIQTVGEPLPQNRSTNEQTGNNQNDGIRQQLVLGKIVKQSVYTKLGTPLILRGQKVTPAIAAAAQRWQVLDKLTQAVNSSEQMPLPLEQARGRKVRHLVRGENGLLVAAPGQMVDEKILEQARCCQCETALLEAVGISGDESTDSSVQKSLEHFKAGAQQIKQGVNHLCQHVKKMSSVQEKQGEEQQIRNALGHPVKQAVLDRKRQVILDAGELITFQAVERAKQAGVINSLLEAVYKK